MTYLYVTRHGQTDANLEQRVQGQGDTPLNAAGLAQAAELAQALAAYPVDRVVSSDLLRARQTAEIVAAKLHVPVSYHPELRARRMGDFENKTHAELAAADAEAFRRLKHDPAFIPPGGGESVEQLRERAIPFIRGLVPAGGHIVVLSHHKVCQLILAELVEGGQMTPIPNARPRVVVFRDGRFFLSDHEVTHGAA